MKSGIHPQYFETKVVCACGNTFIMGSTMETLHIELCSKCHPFYTGEQRFVDARSRIQKFQQKQQNAVGYVSKKVKKQQQIKKESAGPKTLREMLMETS